MYKKKLFSLLIIISFPCFSESHPKTWLTKKYKEFKYEFTNDMEMLFNPETRPVIPLIGTAVSAMLFYDQTYPYFFPEKGPNPSDDIGNLVTKVLQELDLPPTAVTTIELNKLHTYTHVYDEYNQYQYTKIDHPCAQE